MENTKKTFSIESVDETIANILSTDENSQNPGAVMIGQLLQMSDEEFSIVGPLFLDSYAEQLAGVNDKIAFVQALKSAGVTYNDLIDTIDLLQSTDEWIENAGISREKGDFLLKLLLLFANAFDESIGGTNVVNIPIKLINDAAKIPEYSTNGAAGMDVYALDDYTLLPGEIRIIPTGIIMEIPKGYAIDVRPRSGLSAKSKLRIANTPGLIDSDYRGEIGIIIENTEPRIKDLVIDDDGFAKGVLYGSEYTINKGDRIAQLVLVQTPKASFYKTENVSDTSRGDGGYGSTGK